MIQLIETQLDPWAAVEAHQHERFGECAEYGATALFVGTMRDLNDGDLVAQMELEHYSGMTEKELARIEQEACERWQLLDTLIIHRYGLLLPAEPIVLTAVWSVHRGDAFDACRYLMEALKSRAPFWKKEKKGDDTVRWVAKNSDGYLAGC